MEGDDSIQPSEREMSGHFSDTHWSVVIAAKEGGSSRSFAAMETLCRTYWRPVYGFIRRQGHNPETAEDLTQEFFVRLLEKDFLQHLQHQDGKFRSFLLTFVKRFLSDERDRAGAQKRGGGKTFIPLDDVSAEEPYISETAIGLSPDHAFDQRWAQTVMERGLNRLRDEYVGDGKGALFDQLKDLQPGEHGEISYAEIGAKLGLAEGTVKSAVHRLRKRHRELLREEIAQTVAGPGEIDDEIRNLLAVLSR